MHYFPPFALDEINECLWRGGERIALTPKAYAVLSFLVENTGQLVRKEELLAAGWPEGFVVDAVLKVCILDLRRTLGDCAKTPHFIETAWGRGYRFVAPVSDAPPAGAAGPTRLFGRDAELARLQGSLDRALDGARQVVFVTGEPGIGKTTLVETFLQQAAAPAGMEVARGQCLAGHAQQEPYYALLEAIGRLAAGPHRDRVAELLRWHAPTWLAELPSLVPPEERPQLNREMGATRERMLREFCALLEAFSAEFPVVLALEDSPVGGPLDAGRAGGLRPAPGPARLLLLVTYRPGETATPGPALTDMARDLQRRGLATDVALPPLSETAVAAYLAARFAGGRLPERLADQLARLSGGNALFLVTWTDHLVAQGLLTRRGAEWVLAAAPEIAEHGAPPDLVELIGQRLDQLPPEDREVLEAASVVGEKFPVFLAAAALGIDLALAEERCARLARPGLLRRSEVDPQGGGAPAAAFEFVHALPRQVIYDRLPPRRRAQLHRNVAERLEAIPLPGQAALAAELARHAEASGDYRRAARHLEEAVELAGRRYATREAAELSQRVMQMLEHLPESERTTRDIEVLCRLGRIRGAAGEHQRAVADYEAAMARAKTHGTLALQIEILLEMSLPLCWFDQERCLDVVDQALVLSQGEPDLSLRGFALGMAAFCHMTRSGPGGLGPGDPREESRAAIQMLHAGGNQRRLSLLLTARSAALTLCSDYPAGIRTAEDALAFAQETIAPLELLVGGWFRAWALIYQGEWGEALRGLNEAIDQAERNQLRTWSTVLEMELAWLRFQALDFTVARELSAASLASARELGLIPTQQRGLAQLGLAELGLGRHAAAREAFTQLREWQARQPLLMDWFWRMPLEWGLAELALAENDLGQAQEEAELLCESAAAAGERTWQAIAYRTRARVAIASGDWEAAERDLGRALACLEDGPAPLAAWRVHATCGELAAKQGREALAEDYQRTSRTALAQLAGSLGEEPLRRLLEAAAPNATW